MSAAPAAESETAVPTQELPPSPEQLKTTANELFKERKYYESIELYTKAIDLAADTNATLYCNRAAAYLAINKFKNALDDCNHAIRIEPDFIKAHFRAAKCYVHLGQIDDAISALTRMQASNSKRKVIDLAESLEKELRSIASVKRQLEAYDTQMAKKNYTGALISIDSAMIVVDPTLRSTGPVSSVSSIDSTRLDRICVKWQIMRANALVGIKDIDEAVRVAHFILLRDPRNIEALKLRARTMYLLDSHPITTVQQYLTQALTFDPDNKDARALLKKIKLLESIKKAGNDAFGKSDWSEALTEYTKYLEEDNEGGIVRVKVLSNRANVYSKLGKHKEALQDVDDALRLLDAIGFPTSILESVSGSSISNKDRQMSTNSALYYKLILRAADSHLKLEEYEAAIADYQKASEIKPENRNELAQAVRNAKKLLAMSKRKDYYKILGCSKSASESEIKKAYRKMALQCHPDKLVGLSDDERATAEARFKEIGEAYEVLSDTRKKAMYDSGQDLDGSASAGGGMYSSGVPEELFAYFAQRGQSSRYGGFSAYDAQDDDGDYYRSGSAYDDYSNAYSSHGYAGGYSSYGRQNARGSQGSSYSGYRSNGF